MSNPLFRSLNDAVEIWLQATGCANEAEAITARTADTLNCDFGNAAQSGEIVLNGVDESKDQPPRLEPIGPLYFRDHRTIRPQHNMIEPWSGLQPTEAACRNMIEASAAQTWRDVQVMEPGFTDWINKLKAKRQRARNAFVNQERWGLLETLVWIATRDADIIYDMHLKEKSFHGADIRLTLQKASLLRTGDTERAGRIISLSAAWNDCLAPKMAGGDISALATRARRDRTSGAVTNAPGVVFPEAGTPGASLSFMPSDGDDRSSCILKPTEHLLASRWAEYHEVSFSRSHVIALWPAPAPTVVKSAPAKSDLFPTNDRSVWTHAEAAAWVATGDANKNDPATISDHIDNDWTTSEELAQAWEKVQDKLAGGVFSASSSTSDAISPAFWQHAWRHHEIVGESLCDVFRRESGPVPVAATPGGDFGQLRIEQHRDIKLRSSDVKVAFPQIILEGTEDTDLPSEAACNEQSKKRRTAAKSVPPKKIATAIFAYLESIPDDEYPPAEKEEFSHLCSTLGTIARQAYREIRPAIYSEYSTLDMLKRGRRPTMAECRANKSKAV